MAGLHCLRYLQNRVAQCAKCLRRFSTIHGLIQHMKKEECPHLAEGLYTCVGCSKEFDDYDALIQHLYNSRLHSHDLHAIACYGTVKELTRELKSGNSMLNITGCSHFPKRDDRQYVGFTPLHCAVMNKKFHTMNKLLMNEADPNVQDDEGCTPLHYAMKGGNFEMVAKLLRYGGNLFLPNYKSETPLTVASEVLKLKLCEEMFSKVVVNDDSIYLDDFKCTRTSLRFVKYAKESESGKPKLLRLGSSQEGENRDVAHSGRVRHRSGPARYSSKTKKEESQVEKDSSDVAAGISQLTFAPRDEVEEVGHVPQASVLALQCTSEDQPSDYNTLKESDIPIEVITGSDMATKAYESAMAEGMEPGRHLKLVVLGDVGAGKTSLARTLSGTEFNPQREETKGISTHIVNTIELDNAWMVTDADYRVKEACVSYAARLLADIVRKHLADHPDQNILRYVTTAIESKPGEEGVSLAVECLDDTSLVPKQQIRERLMSELLEKPPEEENEDDLKITIWDFAGHNLYQHMHHLFLNDRCLYLVVFSLLKFKEDKEITISGLRHWMNSIAVHTTEVTPVVLVGTNQDSVDNDVLASADLELKSLFYEKFGNYIVTDPRNDNIFFPIDNAKGPKSHEANLLRSAIKEEAQELPHVQNHLPIRWLKCEEAILKQQHFEGNPSIQEKSDLKQSLEEHVGEMTDDDFEVMVQYFHDIALIILPGRLPSYESQDLVNNKVILNPQELVDALARVCDLEHDALKNRRLRLQGRKFAKDNVVDKATLQMLWKDIKIPEDVILALLQAFNMLLPYPEECDPCFSGPSTSTPKKVTPPEEKFLVPCHFKEEDVSDIWREKMCSSSIDQYRFCVDFPDFVPDAVFHHLLVRLTLRSQENCGFRPILRKSMGIFCFGASYKFMLHFVRAHPQIHGYLSPDFEADPCDLLHIIEDELAKIAELFFRNLKFIVGIPCPLWPCIDDAVDGDRDREKGKIHCVPLYVLRRDCFYCDNSKQRVDSHTEFTKWYATKESESTLLSQYSNDSGCSSSTVGRRTPLCPRVIQDVGCKILKAYESLAATLGLNHSDIENIKMDSSLSVSERGCEVLKKWREKVGNEACVETLRVCLEEIGRKDIIDDLPNIFHDNRHDSGSYE